nr:hypothetical protein BaRGS_034620 [Batillaria attramentaria]
MLAIAKLLSILFPQGLGFNVQLCPSSCTFVDTGRTNHVILLVNDLTKAGDLHLVDCATQTPTFRAVPLDFEVESPVYQESFLEYKYIRHDGKILRMHGRGDPVRHRDPPREGLDFIVGKWRRFYCFEIRPTDNLSDLDTAFDRIFTDVEATPTHKILRAFRFPNKKAVMIFNEKLMVEEDGEIQTTVMKGDEEIVANVKKYFPEIKEETFRAALKRWRETFGRLPFDL